MSETNAWQDREFSYHFNLLYNEQSPRSVELAEMLHGVLDSIPGVQVFWPETDVPGGMSIIQAQIKQINHSRFTLYCVTKDDPHDNLTKWKIDMALFKHIVDRPLLVPVCSDMITHSERPEMLRNLHFVSFSKDNWTNLADSGNLAAWNRFIHTCKVALSGQRPSQLVKVFNNKAKNINFSENSLNKAYYYDFDKKRIKKFNLSPEQMRNQRSSGFNDRGASGSTTDDNTGYPKTAEVEGGCSSYVEEENIGEPQPVIQRGAAERNESANTSTSPPRNKIGENSAAEKSTGHETLSETGLKLNQMNIRGLKPSNMDGYNENRAQIESQREEQRNYSGSGVRPKVHPNQTSNFKTNENKFGLPLYGRSHVKTKTVLTKVETHKGEVERKKNTEDLTKLKTIFSASSVSVDGPSSPDCDTYESDYSFEVQITPSHQGAMAGEGEFTGMTNNSHTEVKTINSREVMDRKDNASALSTKPNVDNDHPAEFDKSLSEIQTEDQTGTAEGEIEGAEIRTTETAVLSLSGGGLGTAPSTQLSGAAGSLMESLSSGMLSLHSASQSAIVQEAALPVLNELVAAGLSMWPFR